MIRSPPNGNNIIQIFPVSRLKSFFDQGCNPGSHTAFSCHVALVSTYCYCSPVFYDLKIFEGLFFCRMAFTVVLPDVFL